MVAGTCQLFQNEGLIMHQSFLGRLSLLSVFHAAIWFAAGCAGAQAAGHSDDPVQIEYTISLNEPQKQLLDMTMRIGNVDSPTVDVALPTWRPGRYDILDMAGTVHNVEAFTGQKPLAIEKIDKATWQVTTQGAEQIELRYRIYANSINDRTRHVDDSHAFLDGSAVFMYIEDRRGEPVRVHVQAPDDWRVATGLESLPNDPSTLIAPNYDVLVDSPLEIGIHELIEFDVGGVPHEIVLWGWGNWDAQPLAEDFAKIVEVQTAIFQDTPYTRYVFMIHSAPGMGGGTEHLNSTIMQTSPSTFDSADSYRRFLGLVSHEFFHTWNVKQLRPAGIHPYDYSSENYTKLLWVSEGTTSYYTNVALVRAELLTPTQYLKSLSTSIDRHQNLPGRHIQSLEESSFDAWIKFNHRTADSPNTTVSFYSKGSLVSLMLDMAIREATSNEASLDGVMQDLYTAFPLSGPGFTPTDLQNAVERRTGTNFDAFFQDYAAGTAELELEHALATAGLDLKLKPNDKDDESSGLAYLGLSLQSKSGLASVRTSYADGPARAAGLIPGDLIVALNDRRLGSGDLDKRLKDFEPGDTIKLDYFRRDELRQAQVTLASKPNAKWTVSHTKEPTDQQKTVYESWLGQTWPGDDDDETQDAEAEEGS